MLKRIQGSKNLSMAIIPVLLSLSNELLIKNIPKLRDTIILLDSLRGIGFDVSVINDNAVKIKWPESFNEKNDFKFSDNRGNINLLGLLLKIYGKLCIAGIGGCEIGERPIDAHLGLLKDFGCLINSSPEEIIIHYKTNPNPNPNHNLNSEIRLSFPSFTATFVAISTAILFGKKVVINNVALEPEVLECIELISEYLDVRLDSSKRALYINAENYNKKEKVEYKVTEDRIVLHTLLARVSLKCDEIKVKNSSTVRKLLEEESENYPIKYIQNGEYVHIVHDSNKSINKLNAIICTGPYPFFSSDALPFVVLVHLLKGYSTKFCEFMYENRYFYIDQLISVGFPIFRNKGYIELPGLKEHFDVVKILKRHHFVGSDLRTAACLMLLMNFLTGESEIQGKEIVKRGYENFEELIS